MTIILFEAQRLELLGFFAALNESLNINDDAAKLVRELPPKFHLGSECVAKILIGKEVSIEELNGLLDVIGGFYCSAQLAEKKHGEPHSETADKLMSIARELVNQAQDQNALAILKNGVE